MTNALDPFFLEDPGKLDDPFADLAWLREHRPVYRHTALDQWFVFRYDDVRSLFADSRLSADRLSGLLDVVPATVRDDVRRLLPLFDSWLMMRDGAEHRRLRTGLHAGFNTSAIETLRIPIERTANELLEPRVNHGSLEVSGEFGLLLPAYVLAEFIGIPREERDRLVGWSLEFVDFFNEIPITAETARRMVASAEDMLSYMRPLLAKRRREPREDFPGSMVRLATTGGEITDDEIVGNTMLLLLAGHLPVRNLIGNAIWLLLSDPDSEAKLRGDPALLGAAVEETLRYEPLSR